MSTVCGPCVCDISRFSIKISNNGAIIRISLHAPPINFGFSSVFTPFCISAKNREKKCEKVIVERRVKIHVLKFK